MIDIHAHFLPGIDDGAEDLDTSLEICRMAKTSGTKEIVASPHNLNGLYRNSREKILQKIESFKQLLAEKNISIQVLPGSDVSITPELLPLLDDGEVMTINDGRKYLLAELPIHYSPQKIHKIIFELQTRGIIPVITHPERDGLIYKNPQILSEFIERGCISQVTASSFAGGFGQKIKRFSDYLLKQNMVHVIASDCHSTGMRGPDMNPGLNAAAQIVGMDEAVKMVSQHPQAIIEGRSLNISPVLTQKKGRGGRFWSSLFG